MAQGGVALMVARDAKGRFLPRGSTPPPTRPLMGGSGDVVDKDMGWRDWVRWMQAHKRGVSIDIGIFAPEVAVYASANEFGTSTIPERSFLRATFDRETPTLTKMLDAAVLRAQVALIPLADALVSPANHLRTSIINTIQGGPPPPNAPATVEAKGANTPLVDTGQLQRSLTWRVVA